MCSPEGEVLHRPAHRAWLLWTVANWQRAPEPVCGLLPPHILATCVDVPCRRRTSVSLRLVLLSAEALNSMYIRTYEQSACVGSAQGLILGIYPSASGQQYVEVVNMVSVDEGTLRHWKAMDSAHCAVYCLDITAAALCVTFCGTVGFVTLANSVVACVGRTRSSNLLSCFPHKWAPLFQLRVCCCNGLSALISLSQCIECCPTCPPVLCHRRGLSGPEP